MKRRICVRSMGLGAVILLVVGALVIIGCDYSWEISKGELYPGAPIVSIKETSVTGDPLEGIKIRYYLQVQEPSPYLIKVKLALRGTFDTEKERRVIDTVRYHSIEKGRVVSGKDLTIPQFKQKLHLTILIEPWEGKGSDAYNVGSPSALTVKR